jgi:hypothetical protein
MDVEIVHRKEKMTVKRWYSKTWLIQNSRDQNTFSNYEKPL